MEQPAPSITDAVRGIMPAATLHLLGRPLTEAEARMVADRQASKLLELLGITKPSVEIELLAELPDLEVEVTPDLPHSGAADWVDDHWHVQINADDSLWRCRATLAHEFKHILDDPFREELYPDWARGSTPPEVAERIADYFAGCVLVPQAWLYDAWDRGVRDPSELASLFDVSQRLITVRMEQTKVSSRTSHRWQRASRDAYRRSASIVRTATQRAERAGRDATGSLRNTSSINARRRIFYDLYPSTNALAR